MGWDRDRLEREILGHLKEALKAWEDAWGRVEMQRIGAHQLTDLDEETCVGLKHTLGEERFAALAGIRVADLPSDVVHAVRGYLGERVLLNVQRQLMLDITSRYWVQHLTAMEVLRRGIGLQSYAQKDPLAEYKVRAYDMFQDLLAGIQAEVAAAMFTYRPRDLAQVRVGIDRKRKIPDGRTSGSTRSSAQRSDRGLSRRSGAQRDERRSGKRARKRRKRR